MKQPTEKKVYEAPKLVRYGELVEVTRSLTGTSQKNDKVNSSLKTG